MSNLLITHMAVAIYLWGHTVDFFEYLCEIALILKARCYGDIDYTHVCRREQGAGV